MTACAARRVTDANLVELDHPMEHLRLAKVGEAAYIRADLGFDGGRECPATDAPGRQLPRSRPRRTLSPCDGGRSGHEQMTWSNEAHHTILVRLREHVDERAAQEMDDHVLSSWRRRLHGR